MSEMEMKPAGHAKGRTLGEDNAHVENICRNSSDRGLEFNIERAQSVFADESDVHQSVSVVLCFLGEKRSDPPEDELPALSFAGDYVFPLGGLADPVIHIWQRPAAYI